MSGNPFKFLAQFGFERSAYAQDTEELEVLKDVAAQAFEDVDVEINDVGFALKYEIDGSTVFTIFKEYSAEYKQEFNV